MAKKISFGKQEKPAEVVTVSPDKWVDTGTVTEPEPDKLTRFTIDLPNELHQRIKIYCTMNKVTMKDSIIEILDEKFPPLPKSFMD